MNHHLDIRVYSLRVLKTILILTNCYRKGSEVRCGHKCIVLKFKFYEYQIKSLLFSHHHSTCALVSEILESVLQAVQKQFTYRQYILRLIQKTMCRIHIHTVSTHSVLLDILTVINTHSTQYVHILHYVHIYTHNNMRGCNRLYISQICNVMDVRWMVYSGSRSVVLLVQIVCV